MGLSSSLSPSDSRCALPVRLICLSILPSLLPLLLLLCVVFVCLHQLACSTPSPVQIPYFVRITVCLSVSLSACIRRYGGADLLGGFARVVWVWRGKER